MLIVTNPNLVLLEANSRHVLAIVCQLDGTNRVGFILPNHVQYTKIHCMLTLRNTALANDTLVKLINKQVDEN